MHHLSYTEAITILYSHNTFEFHELYPFISFPSSLLSSRFDAIRSLQLTLKLNHFVGLPLECSLLSPNNETWKRVCSLISNMQGLQNLRVELRMAERAEAFKAEEEFESLAPLMDILQVKSFMVCVGWSMQWIPYNARGWWEKPFEIIEMK